MPASPQSPASPSDSLPESQPPDFLRFENLCKIYLEGGHTRTVLQDATLSVRKGEFVAILGKSGSGKTTLLNLISGIDQVDCGEIFLEGVRLTGMNEGERTRFRRKNIGFIFQFFNLLPTLTVWENILLPLELNGDLGSEAIARAHELLEEVGLDRAAKGPSRTGFRAVSSSGWRSPGHWSTTRSWFWRMNRPATWMRRPAGISWICSTG